MTSIGSSAELKRSAADVRVSGRRRHAPAPSMPGMPNDDTGRNQIDGLEANDEDLHQSGKEFFNTKYALFLQITTP